MNYGVLNYTAMKKIIDYEFHTWQREDSNSKKIKNV